MFNVCDFGDVSEDSSVRISLAGLLTIPLYHLLYMQGVAALHCGIGCSHPRVFMGTTDPACEAIRENNPTFVSAKLERGLMFQALITRRPYHKNKT